MSTLKFHIAGIPYAQNKKRGNINAPKRWTGDIIEQTKKLTRITGACHLRVTFRFPPDKFPKDYPYGPDLDNLLKRLLDGLNKTVLFDAPGKDSCVIRLEAEKISVEESPGADVEIIYVDASSGAP